MSWIDHGVNDSGFSTTLKLLTGFPLGSNTSRLAGRGDCARSELYQLRSWESPTGHWTCSPGGELFIRASWTSWGSSTMRAALSNRTIQELMGKRENTKRETIVALQTKAQELITASHAKTEEQERPTVCIYHPMVLVIILIIILVTSCLGTVIGLLALSRVTKTPSGRSLLTPLYSFVKTTPSMKLSSSA